MKAKLLAQIASSLIRIERTLNYLANVEGIETSSDPIWLPPEGIWEHYCGVEHATIGVNEGAKCDWCGLTKEET
jgi:hypothetical protein